jgi:hypothetical protein
MKAKQQPHRFDSRNQNSHGLPTMPMQVVASDMPFGHLLLQVDDRKLKCAEF